MCVVNFSFSLSFSLCLCFHAGENQQQEWKDFGLHMTLLLKKIIKFRTEKTHQKINNFYVKSTHVRGPFYVERNSFFRPSFPQTLIFEGWKVERTKRIFPFSIIIYALKKCWSRPKNKSLDELQRKNNKFKIKLLFFWAWIWNFWFRFQNDSKISSWNFFKTL